MTRRLLMIGTDRTIFKADSPVRLRQIEYAKEWDSIDIIVFAKGALEFEDAEIAPNVRIYSTNSFTQWLYPHDAKRAGRRIIRERGITHITCQDPFLTAMAGIGLKKKFGKKLNLQLEIQVHTDIASPHFNHSISNGIRKFLALSYLPKADTIRVVSNRLKEYLIKRLRIDAGKIYLKPIAVDTAWIKDAPVTVDLHKKYPQFEKIALMASRLEGEKNIKLAIKAWECVVEKMPKAGLVIVGEGSEKEHLKKLAKQLGSSIMFESWVPVSMLASYYKTADVFVSASLFEGYGMTFIEAQAAGCKVISTDVGIARETGAIIVNYDAVELAQEILKQLQ